MMTVFARTSGRPYTLESRIDSEVWKKRGEWKVSQILKKGLYSVISGVNGKIIMNGVDAMASSPIKKLIRGDVFQGLRARNFIGKG